MRPDAFGGETLVKHTLDHRVVLALPRGGAPVGYEVAKRLDAPLDILPVRKIGTPGHEEYGIGAPVDGASPQDALDFVLTEAAANTHYDQLSAVRLGHWPIMSIGMPRLSLSSPTIGLAQSIPELAATTRS